MAERTTFVAYFLYSIVITGFIYPVVAHWGFSGEGWLTKQLHYVVRVFLLAVYCLPLPPHFLIIHLLLIERSRALLIPTLLSHLRVLVREVRLADNEQDFAGSGVVHVCGGTAALVGTVLLGPRIGRYDPETGKPQGIPGHSTVLTTLGFMILWFGYGL